MTHPSLDSIDHRPWPLPHQPWVVQQRWDDLLFLHWEVSQTQMRQRIPKGLELDLYDGKAWIGIVPFEIKRITRRGLPAPSWLCSFPEINVRTYVTDGSKPGVWFFSLDIPNPVAVWAARTFYHLPYYRSRVQLSPSERGIHFELQRGNRYWTGEYKAGPAVQALPGSFEHWATERYCLYSQDLWGGLHRAEIHHKPWPLQSAEIRSMDHNLLASWDIQGKCQRPLFSKSIEVVVYPMESLHHP